MTGNKREERSVPVQSRTERHKINEMETRLGGRSEGKETGKGLTLAIKYLPNATNPPFSSATFTASSAVNPPAAMYALLALAPGRVLEPVSAPVLVLRLGSGEGPELQIARRKSLDSPGRGVRSRLPAARGSTTWMKLSRWTVVGVKWSVAIEWTEKIGGSVWWT